MTADRCRQHSGKLASERGAILIQVAVAMIVLIAFTAFVVDYGIMWVGRRQAQNAADAGALAGAVALGFDNFSDRTDSGPAKQSAHNFALANFVIGEAPDVQITTDVLFYPDDPSKFPDECADDTCIRVDVYRNQERGNPLPTWFGQLVGVTEQGVRATAIARAAFGDASDCLKPWAVVDRWWEYWENGAAVPQTSTNSWSTDSQFDKYIKDGPDIVLDPSIIDPPGPDKYTPPYVDYDGEGNPIWSTYVPGTGFHPFDFAPDGSVAGYAPDYGLQLVLKMGTNNNFDQFGAGWFMRLNLSPLDPNCVNNGAQCYAEHIKHCIGIEYKIGDTLEIQNSTGQAAGPTFQAVGGPDVQNQDPDSLYNQDPKAYWDQSLNGGRGGVAGSQYAVSPRIVAIPLVDPDVLAQALASDGQTEGRKDVPIANIAGFFVEGLTPNKKGVIGRLMTIPGLESEGGSSGGPPSPFLLNVTLIR